MILNEMPYKFMKVAVQKNISILEIEGLMKKYPYELSGGEKQRVAIARALSNEPELILADEPTENLDLISALNIMDCFTKINRESKKAIIMVTHDPLIASYCKKKFFLDDGIIHDVYESDGNQKEFYNRIIKRISNISTHI